MLRISLTPNDRAAVAALRRDPTLRPADRDRVEMILLSAAGWTVPQLASHFHCCQQTVRRLLHRFPAAGLPALRHRPRGPAPDASRREQIEQALMDLLAQERTWTSAQLAEALRSAGIQLSARQVRRRLQAMGARYRRTVRTLQHKQDPERVAQAKQDLAAFKKGRTRAS
jgi:putative transposase